MVASLASHPNRWVHDALCELAQDPFGASRVRAAIARLERRNALVESLAGHAAAKVG
jgi:hypothetical protein